MMVLVAVIAVGLVVVVWRFGDDLRHAERVVRVTLDRADLDRHIDGAARFGQEFAAAVGSEHPEAARDLATLSFRRRFDPATFRTLIAKSPLRRLPCELPEVTLDFRDEEARFVSTYRYQCGATDDHPDIVKVYVVTEAGRLKVDRIEGLESTGR